MYILLLAVLFMARVNTSYHPHLIFKKYILIKNKSVSKLLVSQQDPLNGKRKNSKANQNKITYAGIVFYILFLLLVCFTIIMAVIPDIPYNADNTLNERLPFIFSLILLFAELGFNFFNTLNYAVEKTSAKRFVRGGYCLFTVLSAVLVLGGLYIAITSIVNAI